jgi:hypothetical protein
MKGPERKLSNREMEDKARAHLVEKEAEPFDNQHYLDRLKALKNQKDSPMEGTKDIFPNRQKPTTASFERTSQSDIPGNTYEGDGLQNAQVELLKRLYEIMDVAHLDIAWGEAVQVRILGARRPSEVVGISRSFAEIEAKYKISGRKSPEKRTEKIAAEPSQEKVSDMRKRGHRRGGVIPDSEFPPGYGGDERSHRGNSSNRSASENEYPPGYGGGHRSADTIHPLDEGISNDGYLPERDE